MAKREYEYKNEWLKCPSYKIKLIKEDSIPYKKETANTPKLVYEIAKQYLEGTDRENFIIFMMDRKNNIIGINTVSIGSVSSSVVHPREVFKPAIIAGASGIILVHNHPSGDTAPSKEDIDVTQRLINAGEIIGIQIVDHVIIGDDYYSLREKSSLNF